VFPDWNVGTGMKNEVTVQEKNIFALVKRRPPYFLGAILAACIL